MSCERYVEQLTDLALGVPAVPRDRGPPARCATCRDRVQARPPRPRAGGRGPRRGVLRVEPSPDLAARVRRRIARRGASPSAPRGPGGRSPPRPGSRRPPWPIVRPPRPRPRPRRFGSRTRRFRRRRFPRLRLLPSRARQWPSRGSGPAASSRPRPSVASRAGARSDRGRPGSSRPWTASCGRSVPSRGAAHHGHGSRTSRTRHGQHPPHRDRGPLHRVRRPSRGTPAPASRANGPVSTRSVSSTRTPLAVALSLAARLRSAGAQEAPPRRRGRPPSPRSRCRSSSRGTRARRRWGACPYSLLCTAGDKEPSRIRAAHRRADPRPPRGSVTAVVFKSVGGAADLEGVGPGPRPLQARPEHGVLLRAHDRRVQWRQPDAPLVQVDLCRPPQGRPDAAARGRDGPRVRGDGRRWTSRAVVK